MQLVVKLGGVWNPGLESVLCIVSLSCKIRLHLLLFIYLCKALMGSHFKKKSIQTNMEKLLTDLIKFPKIYLKYIQAVGYDSPKIIGKFFHPFFPSQ